MDGEEDCSSNLYPKHKHHYFVFYSQRASNFQTLFRVSSSLRVKYLTLCLTLIMKNWIYSIDPH